MSKFKSMGVYEAEGVAAAESLPESQTLETFCIREKDQVVILIRTKCNPRQTRKAAEKLQERR